MHRVVEQFLETQGIAPTAPLVAAVSGGPDSMALLHALSEGPRRASLRIGHVDHGLRAESADEALFVSAYCTRLGVPFAATRLAVDRGQSGNLHARLREARYAFLLGLLPPGGFLLTAHHAEDQALTLLMRFIEGAALPGLAGMRPRRDAVLRPLLGVTRAQIEAYLSAHAVPFRRDPSNDDLGRFRNRLRRTLWPLIVAERPTASRLLADSAAALREDDDALQDWADRVLDELSWGHGWAELALPTDPPPAVLRRAVGAVLQGCFGAATPSLVQWNEAREAWRAGKATSLPGRTSVRQLGRKLLFLSEFSAPEYALDISADDAYRLPVGVLHVRRVTRPLQVRPAAAGDRVAAEHGPHGVFARLAEVGVPAHRRPGWPVVVDGVSRAVLAVPLPGEEAAGDWGAAMFAERIFRGRSDVRRATFRIVEPTPNGL